jgi:hypothetical protein
MARAIGPAAGIQHGPRRGPRTGVFFPILWTSDLVQERDAGHLRSAGLVLLRRWTTENYGVVQNGRTTSSSRFR